MISAKDLIVSAECVETGERLIGYVCCCKHCQTAFENEKHDPSRPMGLLTTPDGLEGNIRVYTDNMEFVYHDDSVSGIEDIVLKDPIDEAIDEAIEKNELLINVLQNLLQKLECKTKE